MRYDTLKPRPRDRVRVRHICAIMNLAHPLPEVKLCRHIRRNEVCMKTCQNENYMSIRQNERWVETLTK